jgi:hypothetical protein
MSAGSTPWDYWNNAAGTDRLQETFRCFNESRRIAAGIHYLVIQRVVQGSAAISEQQQPGFGPASSCVLGNMTCLYLIGTYAENDKVVAAEFWKLVNLSVAAYGKNGDMARREQKAPRIAEIGIGIGIDQ